MLRNVVRHRFGRLVRPLYLIKRLKSHDEGTAINIDSEYQKTTVNILNKEEDVLFFDAYSTLGFKLNSGFRILGPCAVFPKTVLQWNIQGPQEINEDTLSLFYMLEPKLDILILGIGSHGNKINPSVTRLLREKKINVEILPTDLALSTFNFLNGEKRYVAAGLIPPSFVPISFEGSSLLSENQDTQLFAPTSPPPDSIEMSLHDAFEERYPTKKKVTKQNKNDNDR